MAVTPTGEYHHKKSHCFFLAWVRAAWWLPGLAVPDLDYFGKFVWQLLGQHGYLCWCINFPHLILHCICPLHVRCWGHRSVLNAINFVQNHHWGSFVCGLNDHIVIFLERFRGFSFTFGQIFLFLFCFIFILPNDLFKLSIWSNMLGRNALSGGIHSDFSTNNFYSWVSSSLLESLNEWINAKTIWEFNTWLSMRAILPHFPVV